ncbi:MAG: hypothetical protein HC869_11415 [Rhodospirillales bacterium]|nr:hypothetical protein [Rhodospirillales bacterium]
MWLRDFFEKAQEWRLERRRASTFARRQACSAGLTVPETFEKIYAENKWGRAKNGARFYSGDGSLPKHSRAYEDFVVAIIEADGSISTWVDIGCGDFQVASRVLDRISRPIRYVGCDTAATSSPITRRPSLVPASRSCPVMRQLQIPRPPTS